MILIQELLEDICKKMITTILWCFDHATKGTVYRVGPMPDLQVVRITSGLRGGSRSNPLGAAVGFGLQ